MRDNGSGNGSVAGNGTPSFVEVSSEAEVRAEYREKNHWEASVAGWEGNGDGLGSFGAVSGLPFVLGEVYIAAEVAEKQAVERG